jgi:hypothetical protein
MQWFDGGEASLTALGQVYNYAVTCEFGRERLWKVSQTWYREDLGTTIILKTTWRETCDAAKELAEAWEKIHVQGTGSADRSRSDRIRDAARNTRSTRQKLARSLDPQQKRSYR